MCLKPIEAIPFPPVRRIRPRFVRVHPLRIIRYSSCRCDVIDDIDCCWREGIARRWYMIANSLRYVFDSKFVTFTLVNIGLMAWIILYDYFYNEEI